jgi:hypothetical protein
MRPRTSRVTKNRQTIRRTLKPTSVVKSKSKLCHFHIVRNITRRLHKNYSVRLHLRLEVKTGVVDALKKAQENLKGKNKFVLNFKGDPYEEARCPNCISDGFYCAPSARRYYD